MSTMHRRNYCLDNIEKKDKSDISTLGDDMPLIADRIFDSAETNHAQTKRANCHYENNRIS